MPNNILNGKRAVVSGASSGIGQAIAIRFAAEGADVWAAGGNNEVGLKKTLEECAGAPGEVDGKGYDLSQSSRGADLVKDGADFLGGLDILVNCAGARAHKSFIEFTPEGDKVGRKVVELNSQRLEKKIELEDMIQDLDLRAPSTPGKSGPKPNSDDK